MYQYHTSCGLQIGFIGAMMYAQDGVGLFTQRERERALRTETGYCSPAWDCGKGSLV